MLAKLENLRVMRGVLDGFCHAGSGFLGNGHIGISSSGSAHSP
jgi:hypothetical protein